MRVPFQFRFWTAAVLLSITGFTGTIAGADNPPPRELVQYVHEAKRRGLKPDKIKEQAIAVGWPATTVDAALEFDKTGKLPAPSSDTGAPGLRSRPGPVAVQPAVVETQPSTATKTAALEAQPAPPSKTPAAEAVVRPTSSVAQRCAGMLRRRRITKSLMGIRFKLTFGKTRRLRFPHKLSGRMARSRCR